MTKEGPGARTSAAATVTRLVNRVSRRLGAGSGTVAGGRAGLAVDPALVAHLIAGRPVALVSGTNGKTTTTRLLAVALEAASGRPVVTNATGSNMPAGHAAALAAGSDGAAVVLEVDEGYLPASVEGLAPVVVLLSNLSRDQLDRTNEVRMLAGRWRESLAGRSATTVVANADDPLVVFGAGLAPHVRWVAVGLSWHADATGCPACGGRIAFGPEGWACSCGFHRPDPDARYVEDGGYPAVDLADGRRAPFTLALPGRFNAANATLAAVAAEVLGVPIERALGAMGPVSEVAGRFSTKQVGGVSTRLLLAKNPAGWAELLDLVTPGGGLVVVGINARVADGRDPSWLWDVAFERLSGHPVVATGDRCLDLSVRLRYAEVPHQTIRDPLQAVRCAGRVAGAQGVVFIGNYTAFGDLLARVGR